MLNSIWENGNLLTIEEAAAIFKVKKSTFQSWIRKNYLPENLILKMGSFIAIRKTPLEQFTGGELLTVEEVAIILKTNESTFRSWIRRKQIKSTLVLKIGGIIRIKKVLLEKFIIGEL